MSKKREAEYWREKIAAMSDEELVRWIRSLVRRIAAPVVDERRRLLEGSDRKDER
jgi:hypothetical protein